MSNSITSTTSSFPIPVEQYKKVLFKVFPYLVSSLPQMAPLPLVSKTWQQVASDPDLWASICFQAGIPIPLDRNQSQKVFYYEKSSLFLKEVRACATPAFEEFELKIDLSDSRVHFVEDHYLVAQKMHVITVYDLKSRSVACTTTIEESILSICPTQQKLYIALSGGQILVCPLIPTTEMPLLTLGGHMEESVSQITLLANDQSLISYSPHMIKQWNPITGECIHAMACNLPLKLQLEQNSLSMIVNSHNSHFFVTEFGLKSNLKLSVYSVPSEPNKVQVHNSTCSYIRQVIANTIHDASDSDKERTEEVEYQTSIVTLNLQTNTKNEGKILTAGQHKPGSVRTINGLTILARDGYDPKKHCNAYIKITDPDVLELIDFQKHAYLMRIQRDMILSNDGIWSITTFQGTILYVTEDFRLVKVTFPRASTSNKRARDEGSEESLSKKLKT